MFFAIFINNKLLEFLIYIFESSNESVYQYIKPTTSTNPEEKRHTIEGPQNQIKHPQEIEPYQGERRNEADFGNEEKKSNFNFEDSESSNDEDICVLPEETIQEVPENEPSIKISDIEEKEIKNNRLVFKESQDEKIKNSLDLDQQRTEDPIKGEESLFNAFVFEDEESELEENDEIIDEPEAKTEEKENKCHEESDEEEEIKGISITPNTLDGNISIKITNKHQLIMSKLPPGIIFKCVLRKSSDLFNPEFDFYLSNGMKHIISAKKQSLAKKEIFKLSLEMGKYRRCDLIGSIMANTVHNTYWLYHEKKKENTQEHEIRGKIHYNKDSINGIRMMEIGLFTEKRLDLLIEEKDLCREVLAEPDILLRNLCLEGKQNSTKNYEIVDNEDNEYKYIRMNKISDNMFEVCIQHPVSPLQAFAISLTRFDAELK